MARTTTYEHLLQEWAVAVADVIRDSGYDPDVMELSHLFSDMRAVIVAMHGQLADTAGGRKRLADIEVQLPDLCRSKWGQRALERAAR